MDAAGKVYSWGLNNYQQLAISRKAKKVITTSMFPLRALMFQKIPITQIAGGTLAWGCILTVSLGSCATGLTTVRHRAPRRARARLGARLVVSRHAHRTPPATFRRSDHHLQCFSAIWPLPRFRPAPHRRAGQGQHRVHPWSRRDGAAGRHERGWDRAAIGNRLVSLHTSRAVLDFASTTGGV